MILSFKNISKKYGDILALDHLSLEIPENSIYGILGANGSGKSTLMRILGSLIINYSGTIKFRNKVINPSSKELISSFGFLIENPSFYEFLSARKNLEILSRISNINKKNIDKILELVNLNHRSEDKVKTYSYGMKQRLGLAQTLLHDPKVLILDEPNNGLDPRGIKDMSAIIKNLYDSGKTIIISTHILNEVETLCTHFTVLKKGKNIPTQNLNELLDKSNKYCIEVNDVSQALSLLLGQKKIKILSDKGNKIIFTYHGKFNQKILQNIFQNNLNVYQFYKKSSLIEFFND